MAEFKVLKGTKMKWKKFNPNDPFPQRKPEHDGVTTRDHVFSNERGNVSESSLDFVFEIGDFSMTVSKDDVVCPVGWYKSKLFGNVTFIPYQDPDLIPRNPIAGDYYYDSTQKSNWIYDGVEWSPHNVNITTE